MGMKDVDANTVDNRDKNISLLKSMAAISKLYDPLVLKYLRAVNPSNIAEKT